MIRTILMLVFWSVALPAAALLGFPVTWIRGNCEFLYSLVMCGCRMGTRIAGATITIEGLDNFDRSRGYIFMSNHVSNLDPPITIPRIPGRSSALVKKELFKIPIFAQTMRIGDLVPVDRGNREAGVQAVREAARVLRSGVNMLVYPEGGRSWDGKLLPFKKGPFYLAVECGVPVVPITILGSREMMPKGRFSIKPGNVRLIFHKPIPPEEFGSREQLLVKVREAIASALPPEMQDATTSPPFPLAASRRTT